MISIVKGILCFITVTFITSHADNVSVADEHSTWFYRFAGAAQQENGTLTKAANIKLRFRTIHKAYEN